MHILNPSVMSDVLPPHGVTLLVPLSAEFSKQNSGMVYMLSFRGSSWPRDYTESLRSPARQELFTVTATLETLIILLCMATIPVNVFLLIIKRIILCWYIKSLIILWISWYKIKEWSFSWNRTTERKTKYIYLKVF